MATGWLETGRTFLAASNEVREDLANFDRQANERGIAARWLTTNEAVALNPLLNPAAVNDIWFNPLSGRLNPADLTAAYAAAARRSGAEIREGVEVLGVTTAGGRVTGIETSAGILAADRIVVAAGLWSRPLLQPLGFSLAQWPCEHCLRHRRCHSPARTPNPFLRHAG